MTRPRRAARAALAALALGTPALAGCALMAPGATEPSASATPILPTVITGDGDFIAGPVDPASAAAASAASAVPVAPGEYTTPGKAGAATCWYQVYRPSGGLAKGGVAFSDPVSVRLDRGMRLRTSGCQPWNRRP